MSGKQKAVPAKAPEPVVRRPEPQPETSVSNSAVQEQLEQEAGKGSFTAPKAVGGADGVTTDNPIHNRHGGGRAPSEKKANGHGMTKDPKGIGYQKTTEDKKVTRKRGDGGRQHIAEKSTVERRHRAGQIVDGKLQLAQTDVEEKRRGKKTTGQKESTNAAEIDFANPMDSKFTHSGSTTGTDGNSRSHSTSISGNGVSHTQSVERGPHQFSGGVHANTEEFGAHGGYAYQAKNGNSIGGNLSATMKMGRVMGKTVTADDDSGLLHNRAQQISGADKIHVHYRDNGFSIAGGINAKVGVVGLEAHGHYANETSVGYHTTHDQTHKERHQRGEELIRNESGDLANKLDDIAVLDRTNKDGKEVAGLKPGEGVTLQSTTAKGGGGGLSVYGIGGSGSYATEQVQRTVVHRQDDGSYTFDITTGDLQQTKVEGHAGGGAAAVGYKADWGNSSNINLNFKDTDEGRKKMQEFVATGVIPGAIGAKDPDRQTYDALVKKGKDNWSKADHAEMGRIADRVNGDYMAADDFQATGDKDSDVKIRTAKGEHEKSSVYVGSMGFQLGENADSSSRTRYRYDERGINQVGEDGKEKNDNIIGADEYVKYRVNAEGYIDTDIRVRARNWDGEHHNEFDNAGQHYPKFSGWRGSKTGNAGVYADGKDGVTEGGIQITDREVQTFQGKARNLDLSSLTKEDRAAVEKEAALRAKANKPLTNAELAGHLAHKQAESIIDTEAMEMMGIEKGSPEHAELIEDKKKELLRGGADGYLEGKTQDEVTQGAQEIRNKRLEVLKKGSATELQHALAAISSGGDFTTADYDVQRALLDRVGSMDAKEFEDFAGVTSEKRTWEMALAFMMNGKGKTDRGRVLQSQIREGVDGNGNRNNSSSPANRVLDRITHNFADIGDLPQVEGTRDPRALKRFVEDQFWLNRK